MINDGAQADADNFNTAFVSRTTAQTVDGGKTFQKYIATEKEDVATTATIAALSSSKSFVKMTGSTATSIQGITAGVNGQEICIYNASSATVTLANENGSASAANRIKLYSATNIALASDQAAILKYDTTQARWLCLSAPENASLLIPDGSITPAKLDSSKYGGKYAKLSEEQASADGGTATAGSWITRTLNTEVDADGIVTLSSNQFTLAAGTYHIRAHAPAHKANRHQIRLRNITDSTTPLVGSSEFTLTTAEVVTRSSIEGEITISGSKVFEIQHQVGATFATFGFGVASGFTTNVYTEVHIWKVK